jgi:hypothetical protein
MKEKKLPTKLKLLFISIFSSSNVWGPLKFKIFDWLQTYIKRNKWLNTNEQFLFVFIPEFLLTNMY